MLGMKSEVCRWAMWKSTVMYGLSQHQEWAPISVTRVAVLTEIWLIRFSAAQEWLSVIWLTIRHRRGSELFANELTGSTSGASSLLHLLVFQETFSVQHGCKCEVCDTYFDLFYLSRKEHMTKENATPLGKMSVPLSSLGMTWKGCSRKHQLEISRCWQHVTTSPSMR